MSQSAVFIGETFGRELRAEIWRAGTYLADSWLEFGDERQLRLQAENAGTAASLVYIQLMTAAVIDGLASGRRLIGIGYRTTPTISDGPVQIPADAFDQDPRGISGNDLRASGHAYERVKVITRVDAERMLLEASVAAVPPTACGKRNKGGRPSARDEIARAGRALQDQGLEVLSMGAKEQCRQVLEFLGHDIAYPPKGFDPDTVSRHLKAALGSLR